jgi:dynein light intermediate chain
MSPGQSLVRYDNPVLVFRTDSNATKQKSTEKGKQQIGSKKLPPVDDKRPKTPSQTEDILNSILPPRYTIFDFQRMGRNWPTLDSKSI